MDIYGFVHIALIDGWKNVFSSQMDKLIASGLYEKCKKITVTLVGRDVAGVRFPWEKVEIGHRSSNVKEYEFPALRLIHALCITTDCFVLYLHSKGVSKRGQVRQRMDDWRNYMEYFIIEKHQVCIEALRTHDTCGVNWKNRPYPHYSGNFWWARSDYIRTLPSVDRLKTRRRHQAEAWLGKNLSIRAKNLFQSGVDHYQKRYPEWRYRIT